MEYDNIRTPYVGMAEQERAIRDCRPSPGLVLFGVFYVVNKWKDVLSERSLIAHERSKWSSCKCEKGQRSEKL